MAATGSADQTPPPPPPTTEPEVTLADPFVGINPPAPALLTEALEKSQRQARVEPTRGHSLARGAQSPGGMSGEKRRSGSWQCEEVKAKRGWQSEVQPTWTISNIGRRPPPSSSGRQPGSTSRREQEPEGRRSRTTDEPDSPERTKLKSAVKVKTPTKASYESMGPAARSRYEDPSSSRDSDREDRRAREKSRHRTESDRHQESRSRAESSRRKEEPRSHGCSYQESRHKDSLRQDRNTGRPQSRPTGSKGFDKTAACKEYERQYDRIVTNPHKYLEERYPQIDPEFYRTEVHAMRYFGSMAEDATVQVLTLIDWAAEYVKMRNSPVPDIPAFLQSPFVAGGTPARNPLPTDPAVSGRDIDVRTKSQLTWVYFCALLQSWTDEASVSEGMLYGGKRRPTNPLIGRIRAVINPFTGEHFAVTWESIEASTSWT